MRVVLAVLFLLCAAPLWCAEVTDEQMEEALKTWRRYEMPEPPADAKLLILEGTGTSYVNGVKQPPWQQLAFRLSDEDGKRRYCVGAWIDVDPYGLKEIAVEKPDALEAASVQASSRDTHFGINEAFVMSLHLWTRGHKKLGREVCARALSEPAGHHFSSFYQRQRDTPAEMLPAVMLAYWANQLVQPDTDRKAICASMKTALGEFEVLKQEPAAEWNKNVLVALEKAIQPSEAEAGSVEADVHALTEVCRAGGTFTHPNDKPDPHFLAVLMRGFDAVPVLIQHLDDFRLTRSVMVGFNNFSPYIRHVAEIVGDILQAIAGQEFDRGWLDKQKGGSVSKEAVQKWWEGAKELGEEKYLAANMINAEGGLNRDTLYIVAARHPKLLLDKYQAAIKAGKQPDDSLAEFLAESSLSDADKAAAFLEGAKSENLITRWTALRSLQQFDEKTYVEVLVKTLDSFGERKTGAEFWTTPEASYSHLVLRTGDQRAWDALLRAAQRAEVGLRMEYLNPMNYSYVGEDYKEQRLKLLAAFLNDTTVRDASGAGYEGPHAAFLWDKIAVRDFVSELAGSILGVDGSPEPEWTEKEWAPYREAVLKALKADGIDPPKD